jgi:cell division protein FtsB
MGNKRVIGITVYVLMLVFLAWLGYMIVYGNGGIIERKKTERTLANLEEEIESLERVIEKTDLELHNLESNKKYLTQLARELGYKQEGETIFRFLRKKDTSLD